jgi:agmatinase
MGRVDTGERLQVNPHLRRIPGSPTQAFLQTDPTRVFGLTPDTFVLLEEFTQPRTIAECLGDDHLEGPIDQLFRQLLELRLLVPPGGDLGPTDLTLRPTLPRLCDAPPWPHAAADPPSLDPSLEPELDGPRAPPSEQRPVVVLGACYDDNTLPGYPRGAAGGPALLRRISAAHPLRERLSDGSALGLYDLDLGRRLLAGARVYDAGDLASAPGVHWSTYAAALTHELTALHRRGARVILIGGDHSVTLPALTAHREPFALLHLDAHTDAALPRHAGDLHHGNFLRRAAATCPIRQIIALGVRALQDIPPEIEGVPYRALSPAQLRRCDDRALAALLPADLPCYVSVDLDALDPAVAPATPAAEPDGLSLAHARHLIRACVGERPLLGADLVELQAGHSAADLSARAALRLVLDLMDLLAR